MTVARGDAVELTRVLVRVDSRNPSLVPGAPGEGPVARALAEVLRAWGFAVELQDAAPNRPNVVALSRSIMTSGRGLSKPNLSVCVRPFFSITKRAAFRRSIASRAVTRWSRGGRPEVATRAKSF